MVEQLPGLGFVDLRECVGDAGIGYDHVKSSDAMSALEGRDCFVGVEGGSAVDFDDDETAVGAFGKVMEGFVG